MAEEREFKPLRRTRKEIKKEVLKWFLEARRPLRWKDLEKRAKEAKMSPKVLSNALKTLRASQYIHTVVLDDEKGRPTIHYDISMDLPYGKISEYWKNLFATAYNELKDRGLKREEQIRRMGEWINFWASFQVTALMESLGVALKCEDEKLARERFAIYFEILAGEPANSILSLALSNKEAAKEILKRWRTSMEELGSHAPPAYVFDIFQKKIIGGEKA
jgi:hypothetical protein